MPSGSVARSFPKEESELRALFTKGLKKLRSIETQVCSNLLPIRCDLVFVFILRTYQKKFQDANGGQHQVAR